MKIGKLVFGPNVTAADALFSGVFRLKRARANRASRYRSTLAVQPELEQFQSALAEFAIGCYLRGVRDGKRKK